MEESKRKTTPTELLYPPLEGYTRVLSARGGKLHVGYYHASMGKCPCCGGQPVLEQLVNDLDENGKRNIPAQNFTAICTNCELRADAEGDLSEALEAWNLGKLSPVSKMVHKRLRTPDEPGMAKLANIVIYDAMRDAINLINRKKEVNDLRNDEKISDARDSVLLAELSRIRGELNRMQKFFERNPLMAWNETDAVLSTIRRILHPDLTPEERAKIPLKLVSM